MKQITTRLAGPDDTLDLAEWSLPHLANQDALFYPTSRIVCSENGRVIQYALIHSVAMLEGLAPNPKSSDGQLAKGLKLIVEDLIKACERVGVREIYACLGPDDGKLEDLARRNGWEEVPYKFMRRKI